MAEASDCCTRLSDSRWYCPYPGSALSVTTRIESTSAPGAPQVIPLPPPRRPCAPQPALVDGVFTPVRSGPVTTEPVRSETSGSTPLSITATTIPCPLVTCQAVGALIASRTHIWALRTSSALAGPAPVTAAPAPIASAAQHAAEARARRDIPLNMPASPSWRSGATRRGRRRAAPGPDQVPDPVLHAEHLVAGVGVGGLLDPAPAVRIADSRHDQVGTRAADRGQLPLRVAELRGQGMREWDGHDPGRQPGIMAGPRQCAQGRARRSRSGQHHDPYGDSPGPRRVLVCRPEHGQAAVPGQHVRDCGISSGRARCLPGNPDPVRGKTDPGAITWPEAGQLVRDRRREDLACGPGSPPLADLPRGDLVLLLRGEPAGQQLHHDPGSRGGQPCQPKH